MALVSFISMFRKYLQLLSVSQTILTDNKVVLDLHAGFSLVIHGLW